jgi:hypothetical protein
MWNSRDPTSITVYSSIPQEALLLLVLVAALFELVPGAVVSVGVVAVALIVVVLRAVPLKKLSGLSVLVSFPWFAWK